MFIQSPYMTDISQGVLREGSGVRMIKSCASLLSFGGAVFLLVCLLSFEANKNDIPQPQQEQLPRRRLTSSDPKSVVRKKIVNRRKFVSYTSSEWELMWLKNGDKWVKEKKICDIMLGAHQYFMHEFLNATCTSRYQPPYEQWCLLDDDYHPLWYNTEQLESFDISWVNPLPPDGRLDPPQAVIPIPHALDHIFSRFVFLDEATGETYMEYIEPLVSHLRFPLAKCIGPIPNEPRYENYATTFRGYVLPPPGIRNKRALYFDAGASSWDQGIGGPSLSFFNNIWGRHGIIFDDIFAFEMKTTVEEFYSKIPLYFSGKTHFQQTAVTSSPEEHTAENPFLPLFIKEHSNPEDYVLFKLDIDSPAIEDGSILYILQDPDSFIDEVVWEHHIGANYLMTPHWGKPGDISLRQSMEFFLLLRQRGIRSHSWI